MPDKFKDTINVPIAIPAWGLLTMLAFGIFTAGMFNQKLNQLIEQAPLVSMIREKQIGGLAAIETLRDGQNRLEARVTNLESDNIARRK